MQPRCPLRRAGPWRRRREGEGGRVTWRSAVAACAAPAAPLGGRPASPRPATRPTSVRPGRPHPGPPATTGPTSCCFRRLLTASSFLARAAFTLWDTGGEGGEVVWGVCSPWCRIASTLTPEGQLSDPPMSWPADRRHWAACRGWWQEHAACRDSAHIRAQSGGPDRSPRKGKKSPLHLSKQLWGADRPRENCEALWVWGVPPCLCSTHLTQAGDQGLSLWRPTQGAQTAGFLPGPGAEDRRGTRRQKGGPAVLASVSQSSSRQQLQHPPPCPTPEDAHPAPTSRARPPAPPASPASAAPAQPGPAGFPPQRLPAGQQTPGGAPGLGRSSRQPAARSPGRHRRRETVAGEGLGPRAQLAARSCRLTAFTAARALSFCRTRPCRRAASPSASANRPFSSANWPRSCRSACPSSLSSASYLSRTRLTLARGRRGVRGSPAALSPRARLTVTAPVGPGLTGSQQPSRSPPWPASCRPPAGGRPARCPCPGPSGSPPSAPAPGLAATLPGGEAP